LSKDERTPIRVLIAKPGLDGHDVGAKLIVRALMAAGMEVIYTGLRQSPQAIVEAALEEGVDVIGLSVLSGAHLHLCRKVSEGIRSHGLEDVLFLLGGNIPRQDTDVLRELGVDGIFPTGTPFEKVVEFIEQQVRP